MLGTRKKVKEILKKEATGYKVKVKGWVRTFRSNRFIALNDGSAVKSIQVVIDYEKMDPEALKRITTGAALAVSGEVVASPGRGQSVEIHADKIDILGDSDPKEYPLQPKKHSLDFLREIAHLRFRTNTFGAIFRLRNSLA